MLTAAPWDEPDELTAVRGMVQRLLGRHLPLDRALELDRTGSFDRATWEALGAAGLLGLGADEDAGGSGGTVRDAVAVTEELARVLPSLAVDYVLSGMAMRMLTDTGSDRARRWLPDIASGRRICSFGLSEPGVGTDLLNLATTAREVDGQWVVNGRKTWISLASEADVVFTLARTDPAEPAHKSRGLSLIAVPTDQDGVTIRRVHLAGMRAAITCEVFLDDASAPLDNLVGTRGRAMSILGRTLDVERVMAAAISLGIGRAALDLHVAYAGERTAFGRAIGAFQAVAHPAADSICELSAARALVDSTVRMIGRGEPALAHSAMAKLNAAEATARIVDRGMRAMGAMGLADESAMQMYFRDARLQLFSPVSNEMVRNVLTESMGLPRSY
ncbi:acyl-CoA dehydrogenase family protein [Dactylosporangium sucinum]|uniref:Acyl-CoA dehydrogenase n=1 Tax=Dactylosporangium sucinum TaxID=1424081 RepID=A0A917U0F1_9ACTN|nr:acyl-CoA dehydrogenase family protein [Dactylosporangium sucinum]GGM46166.1 acyl-CoA dehydrogenase [Dactylosporangium sucinum]